MRAGSSRRETVLGVSWADMRGHCKISWRDISQMAWKSITLRSGRSAVTMFGVLLGLAFFSTVIAATFTYAELGGNAFPESERSRLLWLVGVSILVAAVGVANSMVQAVAERSREIGTMKALGATSGFITRLFTVEAGVIGFLGACFGMALGWGTIGMVYGSRFREAGEVFAFGVIVVLVFVIGVGVPFVIRMNVNDKDWIKKCNWAGRTALVLTFLLLYGLLSGLLGTLLGMPAEAASDSMVAGVSPSDITLSLKTFLWAKGPIEIFEFRPWHWLVQLSGMILGTILCVGVALGPAMRAAAMDPVVAFRIDPMG